ncbi:single-stranded DNA-binding protein [Pasteurella multocida]|nr:single-stranded DNA-binding protein [Pasteurella multocida]NNH97776.1 single-stranded DNA-binding protein [Pasteurella multocida]NNI42881.1 single-stranded DNA-binding protein [Pasteurella multocida]
MASVNEVTIMGYLGNDPELKVMPDGTAVANISVATSEKWIDKVTNEKKELVEWHRIVAYHKLADIISQYLKKGSRVYLKGKLRTRKWQDKNGTDHYTTEIICEALQMLDSKDSKDSK